MTKIIAMALPDVCLSSARLLAAQLLRNFSSLCPIGIKPSVHFFTLTCYENVADRDAFWHAILGQHPLGFGYPKSLLTKINY